MACSLGLFSVVLGKLFTFKAEKLEQRRLKRWFLIPEGLSKHLQPVKSVSLEKRHLPETDS